MRLRRSGVVAALVSAAAVLGAASFAWACVGSALTAVLDRPEPSVARAGSPVTVRGGYWLVDAAVEVHWGSSTGQVLGSAMPDSKGEISVSFTVPSVAPDVYRLFGVQGGLVSQPKDLEVVDSSAAPGPAAPPPPIDPNAGTPGSAVTSQRASGGSEAPAAQPAPPAPATAGPSSGSAASGAPAPNGPASAAAAGPSAPAPTPAGALPTASPARPAGAGQVPATTPASGLAGSQAGAGTLAAEPGVAAPQLVPAVAEQAPTAAPSPRSASGDLWSGFAPGRSRAPSLTDLSAGGSGGRGVPLPGLSFVLVGLVALAGGFVLAEVARRPAMAAQRRAGRS